MDNIFYKDFIADDVKVGQLEVKEIDDGFVHLKGYASTFGNKDRVGDVVERGAFSMTLTERMPKLLYQHSMDDVVGVIDKAYESEVGLIIEARMPKDNSKVKDIYPLLKMGALADFSIGYSVKDAEMQDDGTRLLKEIDLWEVSIVTIPANQRAKIMKVKQMENAADAKQSSDKDDKVVDAFKAESITSKKEFEEALRSTGNFTRKACTILASRFKEDVIQGDPDDSKNKQSDSVDLKALLEAINQTKQTFKIKD